MTSVTGVPPGPSLQTSLTALAGRYTPNAPWLAAHRAKTTSALQARLLMLPCAARVHPSTHRHPQPLATTRNRLQDARALREVFQAMAQPGAEAGWPHGRREPDDAEKRFAANLPPYT